MKYLALLAIAFLTGCASFDLADYEQWRAKELPIDIRQGATAE